MLTNISNILKPALQDGLEKQSEDDPSVNKKEILSNYPADVILHLFRLTTS